MSGKILHIDFGDCFEVGYSLFKVKVLLQDIIVLNLPGCVEYLLLYKLLTSTVFFFISGCNDTREIP